MLDRPFPSSWTVRRARDAYLEENGFTVAAYFEPWTDATVFGIPIKVPNTLRHRWAIMLHDLHHVATGYGTDMIGEGEVSAWETRRGLRSLGLYVGSIVAIGTIGGALMAPRRALAAWRASGGGCTSLFPMGGATADYEALLDRTVGELRTRLGLPLDGLVTSRALHARAPRHALAASGSL
jgi:ubiquinone biosynthesis protein Coq4